MIQGQAWRRVIERERYEKRELELRATPVSKQLSFGQWNARWSRRIE